MEKGRSDMLNNPTVQMVNQMPLTQKAVFIDQLLAAKNQKLLEEKYGISIRTAARYRRLIHLIPALGELIDWGSLPMLSGVALSYLSPCEQELVYRSLVSMNVPLCPSAADKLKKMSGKLSKDLVNKIVAECKVDYVPRPDIKYLIQPNACRKYFRGMDSAEAEKKIEQILDAWFEEHAQEERLLLVKRLYPKITLEK